MQNNYYWSDNWSEDFYIALAKSGFISTSYDTKNGLVLLPELQYDYAVLSFENLHISKKVKKLLNKDLYELKINTRFDELIKQFSIHHKYNWLKDEYRQLIQKLYLNDNYHNFKLLSVELICKKTNKLVAGEIGYVISNTYTSLSGFSTRDSKHKNTGSLQLVLLALFLQKKEFAFWNFGHPHMEYKKKLGCITYSRSEFLQMWNQAILHNTHITI